MMLSPSDRPIPWVAVIGGTDINPASSAVEGDCLPAGCGRALSLGLLLAMPHEEKSVWCKETQALTMKLERQDAAKPETSER